MAMLGDGTQSYNNDKDGSDKELAGCEVLFFFFVKRDERKTDILFRLISDQKDSLLVPV